MRRQSSPCQNAATRCVIENKTCLHMCLLTLLDCSHQLLLDIFYCSNRILVERVCIQVRGKNGSATSHLTVGRPEKTRPFRGPNFRPFEWGCRWFDGLKKSLGGWKNIPTSMEVEGEHWKDDVPNTKQRVNSTSMFVGGCVVPWRGKTQNVPTHINFLCNLVQVFGTCVSNEPDPCLLHLKLDNSKANAENKVA